MLWLKAIAESPVSVGQRPQRAVLRAGMPPKKKTSADESCSLVFNLLEIGDLEVLRRDFDWSSLHPKEDLPPILFWVRLGFYWKQGFGVSRSCTEPNKLTIHPKEWLRTEWLPKVFAAEVPYPVDILEWLLQAGADPM